MTRGSRIMLTVLRRPLSVLKRMSSPSALTKITPIWGEPSALVVAKHRHVAATKDPHSNLLSVWCREPPHQRVDKGGGRGGHGVIRLGHVTY